MLVLLLNSSLYFIDLIVKTFVLATCTYFFGGTLLTLVKRTLCLFNSLPETTAHQHKDYTSNLELTNSQPKKKKDDNSRHDNTPTVNTSDNSITSITLPSLPGQHKPIKEPSIENNEAGQDINGKESPSLNNENTTIHQRTVSSSLSLPKDLSLHTRRRHRSRTQSFPSHLSISSKWSSNIDTSPIRHSSAPTTSIQRDRYPKRQDSRVGQLVQQFEMGRSTLCNSTDTDIMNSKCNTSIQALDNTTLSPLIHPTTISNSSMDSSPVCPFFPITLTTPVSTRAIDYRSIGFRPAFTTWEKRITEGKPLLVPSKSRSSPAWSIRST